MVLLVKNGTVVNPAGMSGKLDVLIKDGRIVLLEPEIDELPDDVEVIDAEGLMVAPGLVDVHVHFRDPGFPEREDIITGAEAAKAGGFTTVVMMANTIPVVDNVETLEYVLEKGRETGIKVKACAAATVGMIGVESTDMEALVKAGAVGFSDDGKAIVDEAAVREVMYEAKQVDAMVSLHEEDPAYIDLAGFDPKDSKNPGEICAQILGTGFHGADRFAEVKLIERDIRIATSMKVKVNFQHVSTKEGVDLIREGKKRGGTIHAEATPHHFTLTKADVVRYGSYAKMNPPVRKEEDRLAIIEGLRDGTIDIIATDHAPHTLEDKNRGLVSAPSGVIGLETSLGLGITHLVKCGYLTLDQLITRMSYGPARAYGFEAGVLGIGKPADIVIFDENESWRVTSNFASKAENSPFIGWELYGKVKYTICDGKVVYKDAK